MADHRKSHNTYNPIVSATKAWVEKLDKAIHQIYLNTKRHPRGTQNGRPPT